MAIIVIAVRSLGRQGVDPAVVRGIEEAAVSASADLRTIVATLHGNHVCPDVDRPLVERIKQFIANISFTGVPITLSVSGSEAESVGRVGLLCERIVREAITNVVKHSPDGKATINLEFSDRLSVAVTCHRPAHSLSIPTERFGGRGLTLLTQDVENIGGTLDIRQEIGTFLIYARLPLRPNRPSLAEGDQRGCPESGS